MPRTPGQARAALLRSFDARVIAVPARREALVGGLLTATRAAVRVPGGAAAAERAGNWLEDRLTLRRAPESAHRLSSTASGLLGPRNGLHLALRAVVSDLTAGRSPAHLNELVAAGVAAADERYTAGDHDGAAARLQDVFDVLFHRHFHFEGHASPYAADPLGYLAALRGSRVFTALTTPTGRTRDHRPVDRSRPHRLLVTTVSNFNFAQSIIDEYDAREDVEVRTLDLRRLRRGPWSATPRQLVANRLRQADGIPMAVPADVREPFEWADTVFAEWGHRAMAWVSLLPDCSARTVARLHSYEAFTQFPHLTDWSGIDDLVFVADHIRALTQLGVPALAGSRPDGAGPAIHVIPNRNDLRAQQLPKEDASERTLALMGWAQLVKDPMWALDVLEDLLAIDPDWRLDLYGSDFAPTEQLTEGARSYRDAVLARIDALGPAVRLMGYSTDVARSFQHVGVILSSSLREGTHEAVIQAVASGCFPVVRDWPFVAAYGGAHTMFPDEWIVGTPAEAADRIRRALRSGPLLPQCQESARWTMEHYDWSVVAPSLARLLLREGQEARGSPQEGQSPG